MPVHENERTTVRIIVDPDLSAGRAWLYIALALLLCATTLLALAGAGAKLWLGLAEWTEMDSIFTVIERLLVVLMLVEILHTVHVSVRSGSLTCEPFLVVGLIA